MTQKEVSPNIKTQETVTYIFVAKYIFVIKDMPEIPMIKDKFQPQMIIIAN